MRIRSSAALLLFAALSAAHAQTLPLAWVEDFEGKRIVIYADRHQLESPAWRPGEKPLPLGVDAAIARVRDWARRELPQFDDIEIHEIALKSLRDSGGRHYWHYIIYFNGVSEGLVIARPRHFVAVLLDGTVLPAVVEPRP